MRVSHKNTIYGILEKDHKATFENINHFYSLIEKIRYEGKSTLGKHLTEAAKAVSYFGKEIGDHMREEEKVLFPFIRTHIPRLEPMVCLLLSEHEDFRRSLKDLKKSLQAVRNRYSVDAVHRLCERGTYMVCLLRSHMWCESHSLYKAADTELKADEKQCLIRMIKKDGA